MARISFRQGIVRQPTGAWLSFNSGNDAVILDTSSEPLLLNFADGPDDDYLWEENQGAFEAWGVSNPDISFGPLPTTVPYWLYFDIDAITGKRRFGTTIYEPIDDSSAPVNPAVDQHWFDTRNVSADGTYLTMKVWDGSKWLQKIRLFVGKVIAVGTIQIFSNGTQIGKNTSVRSGRILYDDENKTRPIKRFDRRGRGKFITTEATIFSQFSNISGFRIAQSLIEARAIETIPQYHAVALRGPREVGLARNGASGGPYEAVGISTEDFNFSEVRTFTTTGYLTDDNFTYTDTPGTKIFVGSNGELVTDPPQQFSIQQVATVVDENTILVDIQPIIYYDNA